MIRKYPSVFFLGFVVLGIIAADLFRVPVSWFLGATAAVLVAGMIALHRRHQVMAAIMFGCTLGLFSAFNYGIRLYDTGPNHISNVITAKTNYHLFGEVVDWPDLKVDRTEITVRLDSIADDHVRPVQGAVLVKVFDTTTALQRGDRVEFHGRIYPVQEGTGRYRFDYGRYLRLRGISGIVYINTLLDVRVDRRNSWGIMRQVDRLRDLIRDSFRTNLSETSAALASGFLIGETRDIPTDVYRFFRDSGTLHLLAVSGSNVALVVIFFVVLLRPFSLNRRQRAMALLVVIGLFAFLSYGEPSVVRASVMAVIVILAGLVERRYDLNNVIALAALGILLYDPAQHFLDVGFQLSFTIAWGLIFITPRITARLERFHTRWWYRFLLFPFIISLVAQVCATPLITFYFGCIPVLSPLSNLLIVPMVSVAVIGILALLVAHLVWPSLGLLVGSLVNQWLNLIVQLLGKLGGDGVPIIKVHEMPIWLVPLMYLLLLLAVLSLANKKARRMLIFGILAVANLMLGVELTRSLESRNVRVLQLATVPGGIAAVVRQPGTATGDLILTGLVDRDYPIDERIIDPFLDGQGIDTIGTIIIMGAEFKALEDIVHLAGRRQINRWFLHPGLRHSFSDISRGVADLNVDSVGYFSEYQYPPAGSGYYPSDAGVVLRMHHSAVLFVSDLPTAENVTPPVADASLLVLGAELEPNQIRENHRIVRAGWTSVICSRFAQPRTNRTGDLKSPLCPSGFLRDLRSEGQISVRYTGDSLQPLKSF